MMTLPRGELDTFVRLERPVADSSFRGAGSGTWALVEEVWAGLQDVLPSRAEQPNDGAPVAMRRSRVRMDWRDDVMPGMRIVDGDRVWQIVAGPAELGRRAGIELMAEEHLPAGNTA